MLSEEELNKLIDDSRDREIVDSRNRRKGYEAFCDKISIMNDKELRQFAMTLPEKLAKKILLKKKRLEYMAKSIE